MEKAQHLMSVAKQMHDVAERLAQNLASKHGQEPIL